MASLCGPLVQSKRGLLAFLWSIVTFLAFVSFFTAMVFAMSTANADANAYNDDANNNGNDEGNEEDEEISAQIAVTSRAMAFAALWTAVLASLMSIFGTVILGFQSPTGQYYTCCSGNVHRTTPLGMGAFVGALLMFANMTLVCSVLFGEFEIRDFQREGEDRGGRDGEAAASMAVERSSMAFSIMCMFLTILYAGFAALVFAFSNSVLEENQADIADDNLHRQQPHGYSGYIDNRFDVRPSGKNGFVGPQGSSDSRLA